MSKTVEWSLNYKQQEWLEKILKDSKLELQILGKYTMVKTVLESKVYNIEQREKLNELRDELTRGIL